MEGGKEGLKEGRKEGRQRVTRRDIREVLKKEEYEIKENKGWEEDEER